MGKKGTIYLIHINQPIHGHAGHYLGWSFDLPSREAAHRRGDGAKLLKEANRKGIGWSVVRTWEGTLTQERKLKNRKNSVSLCPICNPVSYMKNAKELK